MFWEGWKRGQSLDGYGATSSHKRKKGGMAYLDLLVGPAVHAQRLDLGDVGAQLAVDGGAPHAEEDAQLSRNPVSSRFFPIDSRWDVRSMMPKLFVPASASVNSSVSG